MTRSAATLDRFAALVVGLAMICLGVGLLVWNTHWIPGTPEMITTPGLVAVAGTGWWPWAMAGIGVLLVLMALRWLLIHAPKAQIKDLRSLISADLSEVADAAARVLQQYTDVHSAKGKAVIDRGTRTIDLEVTAHSPATVVTLIKSIDAVNCQIAGVLGDVAVATRTTIHIDQHPRRDRVA